MLVFLRRMPRINRVRGAIQCLVKTASAVTPLCLNLRVHVYVTYYILIGAMLYAITILYLLLALHVPGAVLEMSFAVRSLFVW